MPIIQSAAKRMRQDQSRYRRNLALKRQMRRHVKDTATHIEAGDEAKAREHARLAQKTIDKAAKKRVIHRNTAARKKSQLAKQLRDGFGGDADSSKRTTGKSASPSKTSTKSTRSTSKSTPQKSAGKSGSKQSSSNKQSS